MKRVRSGPFWTILALLAAVILLCTGAGCSAQREEASSSGGDYRFEVDDLNVTYDVQSNCKIAVTEVIKINYLGRNSTGFIRDIPVNSGELIKNVRVEGVELINGGTLVPYEVRIDDTEVNFLSVDIGSRTNKYGESETYCLTYDYCITNKVVKSGLLPLNVVGAGWQNPINHASATVILPAGYIVGSAKRYVGRADSTQYDTEYTEKVQNGRTVISTEEYSLNSYTGITLDLKFEEGALRPYSEFTPYIFAIAGGVLLLIILGVKALFFNKDKIIPIVNFEAPGRMDPLIMGKLIDNKVNPEDVTALIYYWADKGYLHINLDDKDDPMLIRIMSLPADAPDYEQTVFAGLFNGRDAVKTSSLRNVFYRTYERAAAMANGKAKGLFTSSSIGISVLFAVLGGVLIGLVPMIMALSGINTTFLYLSGFIAIIPALVLYALTETVKYNRLKNGKKNILYYVLLALGINLCSLIFSLFIPTFIMAWLPCFISLDVCFAAVCASVLIISRTDGYTAKLNDIVGFRTFIVTAEKDRLEKLIEDDPQFYYHILPYAQVLNVSDVWENKFKDLTVPPPEWAIASTYRMTDFIVINSMLRSARMGITSGMVSRPSSSGSSGHGGSFGGHSGGGFGGGGGRGR